MLSSKINKCGMGKTKNIPFSNGMLYNELDKELLFCSLRYRFQEFSVLRQFPKFLKDMVPRTF